MPIHNMAWPSNLRSQISGFMPPAPTFTEKGLPSQAGKVFIVTGSSSGIGKELVQILYAHDAKIYIAARSEEKATEAINDIKASFPNSKGELVFLHLDLGDLATIKESAEEFLGNESRLDVLWNNAGVLAPLQGSKTKQGYEPHLGTNNIAPFLFTKLLTPLLIETAKTTPANSVRVVWVSSSVTEVISPRHGIDLDNLDYSKDRMAWTKYAISKAGNWYHSTEYAKRYKDHGIISVALHPGHLRTPLLRNLSLWQLAFLSILLYTPIHGAYTELYGGLSPEVTIERSGSWIQPWGRIAPIRSDLEAGAKSVSEGGTGIAEKFWDWSEEQVQAYS